MLISCIVLELFLMEKAFYFMLSPEPYPIPVESFLFVEANVRW